MGSRITVSNLNNPHLNFITKPKLGLVCLLAVFVLLFYFVDLHTENIASSCINRHDIFALFFVVTKLIADCTWQGSACIYSVSARNRLGVTCPGRRGAGTPNPCGNKEREFRRNTLDLAIFAIWKIASWFIIYLLETIVTFLVYFRLY